MGPCARRAYLEGLEFAWTTRQNFTDTPGLTALAVYFLEMHVYSFLT
jgi:hypothetical protein